MPKVQVDLYLGTRTYYIKPTLGIETDHRLARGVVQCREASES
jgi:hypothetical protein